MDSKDQKAEDSWYQMSFPYRLKKEKEKFYQLWLLLSKCNYLTGKAVQAFVSQLSLERCVFAF